MEPYRTESSSSGRVMLAAHFWRAGNWPYAPVGQARSGPMGQCRLAPNLILCGNETYRTRRARHGGARKILDSCTRHSMHRYPSSLKSCSATTLAAARNARLRTLSLISVSSNKLSDIGPRTCKCARRGRCGPYHSHNPPVARSVMSGAVMDDLRASQLSSRPTRSAKIIGRYRTVGYADHRQSLPVIGLDTTRW